MKYKIDTVSKTIEIEEATTKELKKLCKNYEGFTIISKVIWNDYPFVYKTFDGTIIYDPLTTTTTTDGAFSTITEPLTIN